MHFFVIFFIFLFFSPVVVPIERNGLGDQKPKVKSWKSEVPNPPPNTHTNTHPHKPPFWFMVLCFFVPAKLLTERSLIFVLTVKICRSAEPRTKRCKWGASSVGKVPFFHKEKSSEQLPQLLD